MMKMLRISDLRGASDPVSPVVDQDQ